MEALMSVPSRRARLALALIVVGGYVVPARPARAQATAVSATAVSATAVSATAVSATAPDAAAAVEVRRRYMADLDTLQARFVALAQAIPEEKYSWRPAPGVRSVGEAFMHAASEYYTFAPAAYGAQRSPLIGRGEEAFRKFEATATKAEVLKHLQEGPAYARQALGALDPSAISGTRRIFGGDHTIVETSFAVTDDLHEHLGQLIAYARMNGVTPPWSK
jgi:DinB family protein